MNGKKTTKKKFVEIPESSKNAEFMEKVKKEIGPLDLQKSVFGNKESMEKEIARIEGINIVNRSRLADMDKNSQKLSEIIIGNEYIINYIKFHLQLKGGIIHVPKVDKIEG